jgi:hypothetical protein
MMTNRSQWAVALTAVVALGVTACNNDKLTGYNDNPNSAVTAPAPALFTNATRNAVGRWFGVTYDLRGTEFVAQHLAEVQYPDEDAYKRLQGGFTAATFDNAYAFEQQDFQKVVNAGVAASNHLIYGPALVMRTWGFGYLTDTWGDIPYFGALKGDSLGGTVPETLAPTYDKQQLIYADFFKVLAQATTDLGKPAGVLAGLGSADVIYGGDTEAWQRFSNSLRLRFAMRMVNVDPTTAKTQFEAAVAAPGGLISSNAEAPSFPWPGDGVYDNPWANNFKTRDDQRLSNRLTGIMVPLNDPRLAVYGMPAQSGGSFVGLENALTQDQASAFLTTTSRPGAIFYPGATTYGTFGGGGASLPQYLMTYAEVEFLLAEAAERGWNVGGGSAASHYLAGINASMDQWGVANGAARATYLAGPDVAYQGGVQGQIQIATQKWIALYSDGGQAWAEWRRTCRPANIVPGPEAIIDVVPRRFQYSTTETEVNAAGVQTAITNQGADEFETRTWWDKSPANAPTYPGATCGVKP